MREPRWKALLRKSTSACVAAIEIYNKPASPHREETFATLAVCAWEGLLKARLVREDGNKIKAILAFERMRTRDGRPSKRQRVKRNRCGNPMTIGFDEAVARVRSLPGKPLDAACEENLRSLVEIRDNAIHFINEDRDLVRRTHEAGCACLRNYVTAVAEWFDESLGDYRFAILPLSFEAMGKADALRPGKRSQQAVKLSNYLDEAAKRHDGTASAYSVSLQVAVSIVGNRAGGATPVRLTADPTAPAVTLKEADISKQFPLSYEKLVLRVRTRVPGFLANRTFNDAMRRLKKDPRLAHERRLYPDRTQSPKVWYYSDAMVDAVARATSGDQDISNPGRN